MRLIFTRHLSYFGCVKLMAMDQFPWKTSRLYDIALRRWMTS